MIHTQAYLLTRAVPKVYLAGPIKGLSYDEATSWRVEARCFLDQNGIEGLSPMRRKEHLQAETAILESYEEHPMSGAKGLTTRDRWDVSRCDVMLVNAEGATAVSLGTAVEFGWADAYRKPVVLVQGPDWDNNPFNYPMVREIAAFQVQTLEEGLSICLALLN